MVEGHNRPIARILLTAAGVRLFVPLLALWAGQAEAFVYVGDWTEYLALARSLAEHGTFAQHGVPDVYRLPGYPLLLALVSVTGHLTAAAIGVQIALGVLTVFLVHRMALAAGGARLARTAAWLSAFEPLLVLYSGHLLTETLFTALVTGALAISVEAASDRPRVWHGAAIGVLSACAALVRPIGYFLPIVFAAAMLGRIEGVPGRVRGRTLVAVLGTALVIIGMWHVRNGIVTGWWGFSTQADRQLYFTTAASVAAGREGRSLFDVRTDYRNEIQQKAGPVDERGPAFADETRRRGIAFAMAHPAATLRIQLFGSLRVLLQPPGTDTAAVVGLDPNRPDGATSYALSHWPWDTWRRLRPDGVRANVWRAVRAAYWAPFLCAIALGAWRLRTLPARVRRRARPAVWVCAYLLVASGGAFATDRFRHPLMPVLCIVAAAGLIQRPDGDVGRNA